MKKTLTIAALMAFSFCLQAKITLPDVISDNMVLQRNTEAALWGTADPGKKVTVTTSWDNKKTVTTADPKSGKWMVKVATPEAGGPYEITFSDSQSVTLKNILIGEVWFASGQSNMEMPVRGYNASPAIGGTDKFVQAKASRPIRICNVQKQSSIDIKESVPGKWSENVPSVVAETSATAYFFADYLQEALDIPVGIIVSSWGGSTIQTWISEEVFKEKFPEMNLGTIQAGKPVGLEFQDPCLLFNGQVAPLIPFTFKGMIWYQGEANRGNPDEYILLQKAYVEMMRKYFNVPEAPFYFVQIAPWNYADPDSFCSGYFCEGQQKSLDVIPNSGMAVTCDVGDFYNIHPTKKADVGKRLAMLALQKNYGFDCLQAVSPTYKSSEFKDGKAFIDFNVDYLSLAPLGNPLIGFEIAGADKVFHKADAALDNQNFSRVIVSSPDVPEPVAVRYCFRNWCEGNLYNTFGVPAAPFRTDDWNIER